MTREERIKAIKVLLTLQTLTTLNGYPEETREALDMAIEDEQQKVNLFIYDSEKEAFIPIRYELCEDVADNESRSVIYISDGFADGTAIYDSAECPNCGYAYEIDDKDWMEPYCPHCGQALRWEGDDE